MTLATAHLSPAPPLRRSRRGIVHCPFSIMHCRRGFSFTEVLFAVMLLGIGFIMIAAVFPVAIQQNQATLQETTAQAVANDAINQLRNLSVTSAGTIFQTTNGSYAGINVPLWAQQYGLNFIDSADPRFAWVAFYARNNGENDARLIILVLQNHNSTVQSSPAVPLPPGILTQGDTYPLSHLPSTATPPFYVGPPIIPGSQVNDSVLNTGSASAQMRSPVMAPIVASVFYNADGTSSIAMSALDVTSSTPFPGNYDQPVTWAAPGAFVVVAWDAAGGMAGRVFRLGQSLTPNELNWVAQFGGPSVGPGLTGFQLVPGFDLRQDQSEYRGVVANLKGVPPTGGPTVYGLGVFVVGTPTNPTPVAAIGTTAPFLYELTGCPSGTAQDIAVFTATIPCK